MKHWVKLTDEYVETLKPYAKRKVRLPFGKPKEELWCLWDEYEKCFFRPSTEDGFYMDDPYQRPTHVLIG